jgi:SAM-dependent methyltransferase
VACVSAAALAYEILLIRLFSIAQWHHFAHMAISLALLGFGASGTFLAISRERLLRAFRSAYVVNLCLFALAALTSFAAAQHIGFNPEEILWDPSQWWGLLLTYLLLALPFFFAANALGLALMRYETRVTRIYAADLVGAGLGGAGAIALLYALPTAEVLRALALCGLAAAGVGWVELRVRSRRAASAMALLAIGLLLVPAQWTELRVSQFKALSQTLLVAGTRVVTEKSSPLGLLQVVESPTVPLRHAPGLSLNAQTGPPEQVGVFTDADSMTAIARWSGDPRELDYLEYLTSALPFATARPQRVVVLGAGGGAEVLQALRYGAEHIDAVEINPQMLELVRGEYGAFGGRFYDAEGVHSHVAEAREFLAGADDPAPYDLIVLSLTDAFGASSAGLYALHESYLYTAEALRSYLEHLSPGGLVAITRWIKLPPRDTLKIFATAVDVLRSSGVTDPGERLILIRGLQTSTLLVKDGPLTQDEIGLARDFCRQRSFDLAWFPGMSESEANRFNVLQSPWFHAGARALLGERPEAFRAEYKYDIRPATDDRPYFFHFFKWSTLREALALRGRGGTALIDAGYLMLVATLTQALLASVVFIVLPLGFLRSGASSTRRGGRRRVLAYFFLIGLAFLFLEIAFIQKFLLFLHHPVYTVAVVLTAFLVFAGVGSALSGALAAKCGAQNTARFAIAAVVVLSVAYLLFIDGAFAALLSAASEVKILVTAALVAPLGFFMGMPFPQALDRIGASDPALVPWAWAINGCASVVSAVLATMVAIHFGFTAVILAAAGMYAIAGAVFPKA